MLHRGRYDPPRVIQHSMLILQMTVSFLFHLQYPVSQYHTEYDRKCSSVSSLENGIEQNQITEYYRGSLEEYAGRSSVVEIGDLNYVGVCSAAGQNSAHSNQPKMQCPLGCLI